MLLWIFGAACLVATLYVVAARVLPIKIILGYATSIDLIFTVVMFALFHSTMTGLMSATLAGLMLAVSLSVGRWMYGYDRIAIRRGNRGFTVGIVSVPGKFDGIAETVSEYYRRARAYTGL